MKKYSVLSLILLFATPLFLYLSKISTFIAISIAIIHLGSFIFSYKGWPRDSQGNPLYLDEVRGNSTPERVRRDGRIWRTFWVDFISDPVNAIGYLVIAFARPTWLGICLIFISAMIVNAFGYGYVLLIKRKINAEV